MLCGKTRNSVRPSAMMLPQRRGLRRDADAQEGEDGLGEDRGGGEEGPLHDQRRDGVGQDVAEQQHPGRRADRDAPST